MGTTIYAFATQEALEAARNADSSLNDTNSVSYTHLLGGTALWLGAKVTKDQLDWLPAFLIALLTALVSLIPLPGLITAALGWAVMLTLLYKWSGIDNIWPSGVLLALVARIIQILLGTAVILIFR